MADTTRKLFNKQTTGSNNNTWGTELNTNFDEIDKCFGLASHSVTASDVTATDDQARSVVQLCTGTLTGNRSLILPAREAAYWIYNGCAGAFTLTAKVSGQTGVIIPPGQTMRVYCNATDIIRGQHAPNSAADINQYYSDGGGTADAITGVYYPSPSAWVDGALYFVQATAANATTTPTFTPNSGTVTAKTIVKHHAQAVAVGDISGDGHILILKYLSSQDKVFLLNPAGGQAASATASGTVELATDAETITGTDTARATTPANIAAKTYFDFVSVLIPTVANQDYDIIVNSPVAMTILSITTQSVSGTCTLTGKINTTALGGTANSVSSSETTQTHASANSLAAGDNLRLTAASNSSCLRMTVTIKYSRALGTVA